MTNLDQKPQQNIDPERVESFPRGKKLSPTHSPLFWVENKDRFLRQLLIRDIEELSQRRLCVYYCSNYFETSLVSDDIARLFEVVNTAGRSKFDLLIETSGGETDATEGLVSMLKEINEDFRVIVPSRAKSNGTVICLAATDILMGATSELGPIEPYIDGKPASLLMTEEYKKHFFQLHLAGTEAFNQTKKLAMRLLDTGMMKGETSERRAEAIRMLCTRDHFHSHGSVINAREAKDLGLNVKSLPPEDEFWSKIWLLHAMYTHDSWARGIGKFFEGRTLSRASQGDDPAR